jgi:hypothetical protein
MDFSQQISNTTHYIAGLPSEVQEEMIESFLLDWRYVPTVRPEVHLKVIIVSVLIFVFLFKSLADPDAQQRLQELEDQEEFDDQEELEDQGEAPAEVFAACVKEWAVCITLLLLLLS